MPTTLENINILEKYNLTYEAEFVPFSQSRNKNEENKSLNWSITIKRGNVSLTTDYMQGSGHIKNVNLYFENGKKHDRWLEEKYINEVVETGKIGKCEIFSGNIGFIVKNKKNQPQPSINEVLYSLLIDAEVINHSSFEDWASSFGYDEDSRASEKIYNACMKIALTFNQLFNCKEREELQELFQDY